MHFYPFYQWLLFFFAYCFVGWVWETSYDSIIERHFVNRGFLYGTWIPIYGFGAIIMLFSTLPFKGNWVMVYLVGMVAATILELVTGLAMEKIFKVRYWDYSSQKLQFKGYICVSSSLFWGLLSVVLVKWVHNFFEKVLFSISNDTQIVLAIFLSALFLTDMGFSIKTALDIRSVIVKMEKLRDDLSEKVTEKKEELTEKVTEKKEELTEKVTEKKEELTEKVTEKKEELTERVIEKREEFVERRDELAGKVTEKRDEVQEALSQLAAKLVKRNPTAFLPSLPSVNELMDKIRKRTGRYK